MNLRNDDDRDTVDLAHIKSARRWTALKDVSLADIVTIVGLAASGVYFTAVVKAQTDANTTTIAEMKVTQARLWEQRSADKDAITNRLEQIESKLDTLIGEVKGSRTRR